MTNQRNGGRNGYNSGNSNGGQYGGNSGSNWGGQQPTFGDDGSKESYGDSDFKDFENDNIKQVIRDVIKEQTKAINYEFEDVLNAIEDLQNEIKQS